MWNCPVDRMKWTPTPCDWSLILTLCLCIFISLIYASFSYVEQDFKQQMVKFFLRGLCPLSPNRAQLLSAGRLTVPPNPQLIFKSSRFTPVVRNGVHKLSPGYATVKYWGGIKLHGGELYLLLHVHCFISLETAKHPEKWSNNFRKCECIRSCYLLISSNLIKKSFRKTFCVYCDMKKVFC